MSFANNNNVAQQGNLHAHAVPMEHGVSGGRTLGGAVQNTTGNVAAKTSGMMYKVKSKVRSLFGRVKGMLHRKKAAAQSGQYNSGNPSGQYNPSVPSGSGPTYTTQPVGNVSSVTGKW